MIEIDGEPVPPVEGLRLDQREPASGRGRIYFLNKGADGRALGLDRLETLLRMIEGDAWYDPNGAQPGHE